MTETEIERIFNQINALRKPIQAPESGAAIIHTSYNQAIDDVQELLRDIHLENQDDSQESSSI